MADVTNSGPSLPDSLVEVRGRFASDAALQDAIGRLTLLGFDRSALSVPAAAPDAAHATPEAGAGAPNTEADERQLRTLGSSAAGVAAAMAGAAAVVATGGAAVLAVAAAAGAGLASGGAAYAAIGGADVTDHAGREAAASRGDLVLAVRIAAPAQRAAAEDAMRAAGARNIETINRAA